MNDSLIADVESSQQAWSGSSLAESIEGLVVAIQGEGWVDPLIAGATVSVEAVASAMDPVSALLANGFGWAMEYFDPLSQMLDDLTGNPDVVASHARTWENMANELFSISEDLQSSVRSDLESWTGDTYESYQEMMACNSDAIGGLGATSAAMAAATDAAGNLVELTRGIVRDLIADLVARVIVWLIEAIFVVTIPVIASQIAAAVVKWAGRIITYVLALVTSLTNLKTLLDS